MPKNGNTSGPGANGEAEKSVIDPSTIAAYKETDYNVDASSPFVLRVDEACKELEIHFKKARVDCCAYITAVNPFSKNLDEASNAGRQADLERELKHRCLAFIPGIGQHPSNQWPGEPSFLVLGLSLEAAKTMGRKYEQNALVWAGPDMTPRLILLR
ncbi:MAG: hypothetical protein JW395_2783 [Nitrospira sp.]|nr:hypothetical protein [Nitrospira sp.]